MDVVTIFSAAIAQIWYVFPLLVLVYVIKSNWFKGVFGEFLVNRLLGTLPKSDYVAIKDVTLPTEDGTTQIDHIVVSKFGIFVVETKNMKGWIFGSAHQKRWTQKIYRHSSTFQNPLHQNYKHTKTLESLLDCDPALLHSLIIFVGGSSFKTQMPANVTYGRGGLRYIRSFRDVVMTEDDVQRTVETLNALKLNPGIVTSWEHRKHVQSIVSNMAKECCCPRCGSDMVIRETKRGANVGHKFWGCSSYPKCRAVLTLEETVKR